ncbi:ABC transporter permease [Pseudochrobactrum asaccharolyticum]|uniref:Iron(III) transport system permease protein n=1 Tax=Pseudochrobactrum asaccharolyticum TaxID=354351 RepID=A0A366DP10_9HYPH|nr:ABC transporter permease subunit [Pseudochrobactrum asaccharolyticum]RBO90948.1 iron(III) transport system permease protein [Pseudochrobactrum asaccharolyticum]
MTIQIPNSTSKQRSSRALKMIFARHETEIYVGIIVVITLFVLILAPLLAVFLQAFAPHQQNAANGSTWFSDLFGIFERPLWRQSLFNSLQLSLFAAVIGGFIGTSLAILRYRIHFALSQLMDASAWLVLILPSFVIAQGWILFSSRAGIANQWLGLSFIPDMVFNPVGLAVVMSLKAFPLAYLAVSSGLRWRMEDLTNAARLSGASAGRVLWSVDLPLLLPAILSGCVLIFIDVIGDFGLPAALATTYRFPTLTYAIYVAINQSPIRFDLAGILAFYVTAILLFAVWLYFLILRRSRFDFLTARAKSALPKKSDKAFWANLYSGIILILAVGIPLGASLLISVSETMPGAQTDFALTLQHYRTILSDGNRFIDAFINSAIIAAWAACGSAVVAFFAAYVLTFSNFKLNRLIDLTCTLSLAVPGVVLGIGYIFIWNSPLFESLGLHLYGSPVLLGLAGAAGAIPVTIRILLGAFAQLPQNMLSAAALNGASFSRRVITIALPVVATALISATLAGFGSALFDLAINTILRPPRLSVLPVYVNRAFEMGDFGSSTAATFMAGGIAVVIIRFVDKVANLILKQCYPQPSGKD